jgi:hypothetical protein
MVEVRNRIQAMNTFIVRPLAAAQIPTVYPLVREAVPILSPRDWSSMASRFVSQKDRKCGIMVAQASGRRYPSGLFCYHVQADLEYGQILTTDYIVALDILDPAPVIRALLAEMDALAAGFECGAVRAILRNRTGHLAQELHAAGHLPEGASLLKPRGASAGSLDTDRWTGRVNSSKG